MSDRITALSWPMARLGEALEALAKRSGLALGDASDVILAPPAQLTGDLSDQALGRWIDASASQLGLEAEAAELSHSKIPECLLGSSPVLVRVGRGREPRFLAILGGARGRRVELLSPALERERVGVADVRAAMAGDLERPLEEAITRLLTQADLHGAQAERARRAILDERLAGRLVPGVWLLSLSPSLSLWRQARLIGLPRRLATLASAHAVRYVLWLLAWWMVGRAAFGGHLEPGWLLAWVLLLASLIPFGLLADWTAGLVAIAAGGLLKQRLLHGALRLEPEEIRKEGAGHLLGRVSESEAVESLALSGGLQGFVALIELTLAAGVLALGAGGGLQALLLGLWLTLTLLHARRLYGLTRAWSSCRLGMTHDLVERMVGQRTRQAQEPPERWHEGEDQQLEAYLAASRRLDRGNTMLLALAPRGYLFVGLTGLAPVFMAGSASNASLAVALGGILLSHQALTQLCFSLKHLAAAATAWHQVAPLYEAAARPLLKGSPSFALAKADAQKSTAVIEGMALAYRYAGREQPVLNGAALRIDAGDRILLEGPSGAGKSTFASLLVGLKTPQSGLLLLDGLDRPTLGEAGWRRRAVAAPQFHDNHVLAGTLAFNLLMGRRWPAHPSDLQEAAELCQELGLGELLRRMPAGLMQMVGETGWQLSHGEKSRLYIARALLQNAELVVLDESFAALDPETLSRALRTVLARAPALVVIAHP